MDMLDDSSASSGLLAWLNAAALPHLERLLLDNGIDADVLSSLTEPDLEKLGLSMGDRKRFMRALSASTAQTDVGLINVAQAGELRQLTIMFCDLVDSTTLCENLTPEQWREVVLAYQRAAVAVIQREGGAVAQYLGDGLLVYFGYPRALEDAAVRAMRAALDMVHAIAHLQISVGLGQTISLKSRVGIDTGTVVIGDMGAGARREQLALGDAPNLAARLQALARPNTVMISDATRKLAGGHFTYEDQGVHTLRGVREPRQVWRVSGEVIINSRFDANTGAGLSPLVGRTQELALLLDRWQAALQGQGQVVLLSGEPGIGKSRMVKELRDRRVEPLVAAMCASPCPQCLFSGDRGTGAALELHPRHA
jgi:class 3 adenylate cyclase